MVLAALQPTPGMKCIRHLLLAFNAIFAFTGVILISVGSTVKNIYNDYATFLENRFFSPSIAIIAVGCLVFVVAVFGCYGAVKLSVAAISVYCLLLATIFTMEVVVSVIAYVMGDQIKYAISRTFNQTIQDYKYDPVAANAIDSLQNELYCCGIEGPDDWAAVIDSHSATEIVLPASCCAMYEKGNCIAIKLMGCLPQLQYLIDQSSLLLSSTVIMIALMQLLGVIFARKLGRQLREQKTERDRLRYEVTENIIKGSPYEYEKPITKPEYSRLPSYSESTEVNEKPIVP
ncbi:hypothetical protein V9T40_004053 [Parthenolecanium corni]|uniref:Tetraspanin n=1 Tax=Parthenolecanium corni TaxID=536013 RepID=A0AAN9TEL2_9HEMI